VLLAVCLLLCGGCNVLGGLEILISDTDLFRSLVFDSDKYLEEFEDSWSYQCLTPELQANYGDMYTAVMDGMDTDTEVTVTGEDTVTGWGVDVRLSYPLADEKEIERLFAAFTNDNPQFFYIKKYYGMYGFELTSGTRYNRITLLYNMDAAARKQARAEVDQNTADILAQVAQKEDAFEKELLLHEWLVNRCAYDYKAKEGVAEHAYTMYGALTHGDVVCEGYSRGMQWLLLKSGIPCTLVSGFDLVDERHMWNLVVVNDAFYHLDVTWNDAEELPRHNYFNLTTDEIEISHRLDDSRNFELPDCTKTKENYYHRTGKYLDTYNRKQIAAVIANEVKAGKKAVELRFPLEKYNNAVLFIQSGNYFFETVEQLLNGKEMWNFRLYGEPDEGILLLQKAS
jgi:hypothetical protein